jgi:hypothetical protein
MVKMMRLQEQVYNVPAGCSKVSGAHNAMLSVLRISGQDAVVGGGVSEIDDWLLRSVLS